MTTESINEGEFPVVVSDSNFLEETELKLRDIVKEILENLKKPILIPDLIAISHKTSNLAYDENLSSYEMIEELCNSLGAVKAEYFIICIEFRVVPDIRKPDNIRPDNA